MTDYVFNSWENWNINGENFTKENYDPIELWKRFETKLVRNGNVDVDDNYHLPKDVGPGKSFNIVALGLYYYDLLRWYQHFPPGQVTTYTSNFYYF